MKKVIPVLLLTGYLGSGKTTLLNRILKNQQGIRFAVIVNDIGEVNIDENLIAKGGVVNSKDENLVPLTNGCICCTLKMDLVEQLSDLCSQDRFDYIVIEASGICEPAPIAQTICTMPQMDPRYTENGLPMLDCIVSVVDALRLRNEFASGESLQKENLDEDDLESLVIQQIEFCNVILLNKASEVSDDERKRIKAILSTLQPHAEIIETDYCDVPFDKILETGLFDWDSVVSSPAWVEALEDHDEHDDEGEALEYGIQTHVWKRRPALDMNRFDYFVTHQWPKNVIRCKGLCYFDDNRDMCQVFEQAGQQMSLREAGLWYATMNEDELRQLMAEQPDVKKDWDETYGDRMQKLVFIGQNLDTKAIDEALDQCLEK